MRQAYSVKWQQEIDLYRQFNTTIILEGNIVDKQLYYVDDIAQFASTEDYLREYLEGLGYEYVVFFDHHNGFRFFESYNGEENKLRADGNKMKAFKELFPDFPTKSSSTSWFTAQTMQYILQVMQNEKEPVAFIMQEASHYVERPDKWRSMMMSEKKYYSNANDSFEHLTPPLDDEQDLRLYKGRRKKKYYKHYHLDLCNGGDWWVLQPCIPCACFRGGGI